MHEYAKGGVIDQLEVIRELLLIERYYFVLNDFDL